MKKYMKRAVSILLVTLLAFTFPVTAMAADRSDVAQPYASYYISQKYASISASNGDISVYFDITAKSTMTEVGATVIRIKNSSGTTVKTFYSSSTSGMMGSNCICHFGTVTYTDAVEGAKYYAVVSFKAANSSGSDTAAYTTGYVTA